MQSEDNLSVRQSAHWNLDAKFPPVVANWSSIDHWIAHVITSRIFRMYSMDSQFTLSTLNLGVI